MNTLEIQKRMVKRARLYWHRRNRCTDPCKRQAHYATAIAYLSAVRIVRGDTITMPNLCARKP